LKQKNLPAKHRNDTKNEKTTDKFCFHFVCFVFFVGKNSFQTISTPSSLPENPLRNSSSDSRADFSSKANRHINVNRNGLQTVANAGLCGGFVSEHLCALKVIVIEKKSVGCKQKQALFEMPSEHIWRIRVICFFQLHKSYPVSFP